MITYIKGIKKLTTIGTGYIDDVTLFVSLNRNKPQMEQKVLKRIRKHGNGGKEI